MYKRQVESDAFAVYLAAGEWPDFFHNTMEAVHINDYGVLGEMFVDYTQYLSLIHIYKALYEREPLRYCEEVLGLEAPKVLISKIKIDSLFCLDGFRMHLSGRTGNQLIYKNANPLVLDPEWAQYIKQAAKCVERYAGEKEAVQLTAFDAVDARRNCELYQILLAKLALQPYRVKYGTPDKTLAEHAEAFRDVYQRQGPRCWAASRAWWSRRRNRRSPRP